MNVLKPIDNLISRVTMYRILVYGLGIVLAGAMVLSLTHHLALSAGGIALSVVVLTVVCALANYCLATIFEVPANNESWLITALILACILPPEVGVRHLALVALGGLLAIASKFVLAINRKHLFNPAAIAALFLGLTKLLPATWWVGSSSMIVLTALFGIVVLRKVRRYQLFASFLVVSLLFTTIIGMHQHLMFGHSMRLAFLSSPLIFLGSVMLTEPETGPPLRRQLLIFGAIVGFVFVSELHVGSVYSTPEVALIIGNLYAYAVSPKRKLKLQLAGREQLAPALYDFAFKFDKRLNFLPGQYLEWTLSPVSLDSRGNRRTFSIASAPDDDELHIAIKAADKGSAYKTALLALKPGATMMAGQLAGNFILPKDKAQKLVFIAGGIGITPFVSMVKDMVKKQQKRDIVLFYLVADPLELVYKDLWKSAEPYGLKLVPVLTKAELATTGWQGQTGRLTDAMIKQQVADYASRRYYLSGPPGLVDAYKKLLLTLSVRRRAIVVDHFSGY